MIEKRLKAVAPQLFTLDGTVNGIVTITDTRLFKVKQKIIIKATALPDLNLEIKRVYSSTQLAVGEIKHQQGIDHRSDISAYILANAPFIFANEQPRSSVPEQEVERSTYEEEPTVARRVMLVDILGDRADFIRDNVGVNRLAVDANITLSNAEINLDFPKNIKVFNIPVLNANTEIPILLQSKTQRVLIKVRDGEASLKLGFIPGSTLIGPFLKINRGALFDSEDVDFFTPTTIYINSEKAGVTVEILDWYFP